MPRPKVHPSRRQRVAEACSYCRRTKKRCDGALPCSACVRKGRAETCGIPTVGSASVSNIGGLNPQHTRPASPPLSDEPDHTVTSQRTSIAASDLTGDGAHYLPSASLPNQCPPDRLSESLSSPRNTPQARMLLNSRGERVFIGNAASISFLQLVRDTVARYIGPSTFSHNEFQNNMLETQSPSATRALAPPFHPELDYAQRLQFADSYRVATGGFLDLFSSREIEGLLEATMPTTNVPLSAYKRASIDLVIAIGAQCDTVPSSQATAQSCFAVAQSTAFEAMLEDPSVDMVRTFILMSFYMLGDCRRNAAFMCLGTAARAAIVLGMHNREGYIDMNSPKYQLRLRIWMSLWVLDNIVCSILGRPSSTANLSSDMEDLIRQFESGADHDAQCLIASYRITKIIVGVTETLYDKHVTLPKAVDGFLQRIDQWRGSLAPALVDGAQTLNQSARDSIANVHVSCLYYFALMLVTRPSLIATLTTQAAKEDSYQSELGSECLNAAYYLVETCKDAQNAQLLLGNMCIMKALIFAAGLILGFNLFAKTGVDFGIETGFSHAREVLEVLAAQSPQAAHYLEILNGLASAIRKQREQIAATERNSRHVKRLFSVTKDVDMEGDFYGTAALGQQTSTHQASTLGGQLEGNFNTAADNFEVSTAMQNGDDSDIFQGWDSLDLLHWDNFPFLAPPGFREPQ